MIAVGRSTLSRVALLSLIAVAAFAVFCAHAAAAQYINMPKYDIELTPGSMAADTGSHLQVTSHVVLLYYQMGTDPSVPGIYVEYELKGPTGTVVSTASGISDSSGLHYAEMLMPSDPGEYTLTVRAYDTAGGEVNGLNEARVDVRQAAAPTIVPATATPDANTPLTPTAILPTTAPPTATPDLGGLPGYSTLLLIGGAIVLLVIAFVVVAAVVAFFLLRKKKKPAIKPVEPAALPGPAPEAPKRFCMHCGAPMGMLVASCTSCGRVPPSGVDTKECPGCHTVIPELAKFCHKCGLIQPETAKPQQQPQEAKKD